MSGSDILREVDEAIRVEKAQKFWHDHGKAVIACAVALVLGTAANSAWTGYQNAQAEKATSQFIETLKTKDPMEALVKLSSEKKGAGSSLAGLSAASLLIGEGKWEDAITRYEDVIANSKSPKTYKDLATTQMVALKIDHDAKATPEALLALIAPVVKDKSSAWNTRAVFLQAIIKANKNKDFKGAHDDLQQLLADPNLSNDFLDSVKALDETYKLKGDIKE